MRKKRVTLIPKPSSGHQMDQWFKIITHVAIICMLAPVCKTASDGQLTIIHTNDVHMHFDESGAPLRACALGAKCFGGVARVVELIKGLQKLRTNVLVVDSGGLVDCKIIQDKRAQEAVKDLVNLLPYDVMTLGESELAGGLDGIAEYFGLINADFVCTNLQFSQKTKSGVIVSKKCRKSMVKMFGALKVGIVSYIGKSTMKGSIPGIKLLDEATSLQNEISHLQNDYYVNTIVVLAFSNRPIDHVLLNKVSGVTLLITGHSHAMFYNGDPPSGAHRDFSYPESVHIPDKKAGKDGRNVLVVGAYFHLLYVGILKVSIGNEGKKVKVLHKDSNPRFLNGPKDNDTETVMIKHREYIDGVLGKTITQNVFLLDGSHSCYSSECPMGNLLTDAMVDAAVQAQTARPPNMDIAWTATGTALLESNMIRSSVIQGDIRQRDLSDVIRHDTSVELVLVLGSELIALLDRTLGDVVNGLSPYFLHVSGLQIRATIDKPSGERLESAVILCTMCEVPMFERIEPDRTYMVAMTGSLADREMAKNGSLAKPLARPRRQQLHKSLINDTANYLRKLSPVMVRVGDRLLISRLPKSGGHAGPSAAIGSLLALVLAAALPSA